METLISLHNIQQVYFIGIGGIGMSALARYSAAHNVKVSGYDRTETALTRSLEDAGIKVVYEDSTSNLPDVDLVVYTPAIPGDSTSLRYYREKAMPVLKRSEVLELITRDSVNICIAGTHGKTTISTMTAHILRHSGHGCNAFLGGISKNYDTNFWSYPGNTCVIEADEYDRSFLKLHPDTAVISSMDADHLDIYGTEKALHDAFIEFTHKLKDGGVLFSKHGLPRSREMFKQNHLTYSLQNDAADIYASNIVIKEGTSYFDIHNQGEVIHDVALPMGGMHNVENALVAAACARNAGVEPQQIKAALHAFEGIRRRFEYVYTDKRVAFIDDYAHHPAELAALIKGTRSLFRGKRLTVIFQPHLFSRTKDHATDFAGSLNLADQIIILPIYPARELPMEGVTSELILQQMHSRNAKVLSKEECITFLQNEYVKELNYDLDQVLVTAGAGDIDKMVGEIKSVLQRSV